MALSLTQLADHLVAFIRLLSHKGALFFVEDSEGRESAVCWYPAVEGAWVS